MYYDPNRTVARDNYLPGLSAVWGELVVGDLHLIEKLTGKRPHDAGD